MQTLNWEKCQDKFDKKQEDFVLECSTLFDISKNLEKFVQSDRIRQPDAIDEDLRFYQDQKGKREYFISPKLDEKYQEAVEAKKARAERLLSCSKSILKSSEEMIDLDDVFENDADSDFTEQADSSDDDEKISSAHSSAKKPKVGPNKPNILEGMITLYLILDNVEYQLRGFDRGYS